MKRNWAYLKAVLRHKWFVFLACFRFGVPIWSAILHDWDKFSPDEWTAYAETFYDENGDSQYVSSGAFAYAWMKHQHRNKHHWQYWVEVSAVNIFGSIQENDILIWDRGEAVQVVWKGNFLRDLQSVSFYPNPMPDSARREMLADWFGAGRAYNKNWTPLEPRKWYEKNKEKMQLHPTTRFYVEQELMRQEALFERRRLDVQQ